MNLLLDTHAFIWFFNGDNQLPTLVKERIEDISNNCFLSIASLWEIAIKNSLGKLDLKDDFKEISKFTDENEIKILPIAFQHLETLRQLEFHHRDPFDRIIIAQSISENLSIITKDGVFHNYKAIIIWT